MFYRIQCIENLKKKNNLFDEEHKKKTQLRGYKNDYNFLKAKQIKYLSQLSCFTNATKSQAPAKASRCNVSEKFVLGLKKRVVLIQKYIHHYEVGLIFYWKSMRQYPQNAELLQNCKENIF